MCFYVKAKALYLAFREKMHLGIIKITYNRTECVFACVREGDTVIQPRLVYCKFIRASSLCLSCDSVPLLGLN